MMSRKMQQKAIILANLEASWIMTFAMVKTAEDNGLEMLQGIHLIIHRLEAICLRRKAEALEAGYDMSKSFANKSVWARLQL